MSVGFARALILAVAISSLMPCAANAQGQKQTNGSNISVMRCEPHQHPTSFAGHPWIDPYGTYHTAANFPYIEGFLGVQYSNDAPVAATEVEFGLVSRDWLVAVVRDVGSFARGATIDHEFSLDPQIFPIGTALPYCAVLYVKYADGTVWFNPSPPRQ